MAEDARAADPRPYSARFSRRRAGVGRSRNATPAGRDGPLTRCAEEGPMARERSELAQRRGQLTRSLPGLSETRADTYRRNSHRSPSTRRPVSALPVTRRAVDVFDHPGLFMVPLDRPRAMSAAAKTHEPPAMRPGRARVAPTDRHKGGLHRYCSGCAQETEHVAWVADGRGSTPSIRWPTTEPAIGTTICLNCGQWRAASRQPMPRTWSSWPRSRIARPSLAVAADSADTADDWASETAAESEGMPPRREPLRLRRRTARLRRPRAVAR